ncbi:MAG: hypothetical protein ACKO1R_02845 [Crocinitomicaceae bacterium]
MKTKHVILICLIVSIFVFIIGFFAGWEGVVRSIAAKGEVIVHKSQVAKDYTDVGGNIDIEYYLEVSEDSIWIQNVSSKRVYGGKYSQLDSLINVDNL